MITSPIMPKTAILATSHKITILLKHNGGEKKCHQKMPEICFMPCLKNIFTQR